MNKDPLAFPSEESKKNNLLGKGSFSDVQTNNKKRNWVIFKIILVILLLSLVSFFYWFFVLQFEESTDDAYVDGNAVILMSPQEGIVTSIYTDNTQYVEQGQLLIELDSTNYQLAFDKACVDLALAARQVKQLIKEVEQHQATVALRQAEVKRTTQDYENRAALRNTQAISKEDLTHAEADLSVAQANLNLARHQLEASEASLGAPPYTQQPLILNAAIALHQSFVQLKRCKVLAPLSGLVAQRTIQVGEFVTSTKALLSIIPVEPLWINANFKETQLKGIRIGQPVKIKTDLYGSTFIFKGKVEGIVSGTGSVFSLIPPQNATGNWIKIVQRVPVRIQIDQKDLEAHPLFLGLSNNVTVDITDQTGLRLADFPLSFPRFQTPVFTIDRTEINELIHHIIKQNLDFPEEISQ